MTRGLATAVSSSSERVAMTARNSTQMGVPHPNFTEQSYLPYNYKKFMSANMNAKWGFLPTSNAYKRWLSTNTDPMKIDPSKTTSKEATGSSPFASNSNSKRATKHKFTKSFVPPKAAINLTDKARTFFKSLLQTRIQNHPETKGVMLKYQQASDGQPRMVFTFGFVSDSDIQPKMGDEGVSLELLDDGVTPKSPLDAFEDGLPKLYIHHSAFLKVLGATIDTNTKGDIVLFDREGNRLDPNV